MIKKILTIFALLLIIFGGIGIYGAIKSRDGAARQKLSAKAPQTSITLLEGWNNKDIAAYLEKNQIVASADFLDATKNFDTSEYVDLLSKPKDQGLEGFLFPDTYFIPKTASTSKEMAGIIIQKALDNFSKKITPTMNQQAALDGMDLYKIITLASIIEKESGANQDDRKTIAGVFYNRLKAGMPLESDATVSFVTETSPISTADTLIDSPYNTYKYKGLPPGPICNPGLNSIMAALYPTPSDYLFFLTIPQTSRAVFAKTYDEHLKNKQKYLR
jgi:UPF0755 protein